MVRGGACFWRAAMDSRGPFPAHVTDALESYYRSGMDGWSGDKGVLFREAVGSIPLNETQLKVQQYDG